MFHSLCTSEIEDLSTWVEACLDDTGRTAKLESGDVKVETFFSLMKKAKRSQEVAVNFGGTTAMSS